MGEHLTSFKERVVILARQAGHAVLDGLASIGSGGATFTLNPTSDMRKQISTFTRTDAELMRDDWAAAGNDLHDAIQQVDDAVQQVNNRIKGDN